MCGGVDTQKLKKCGPSKRVRGVGGVGAKNGTVFALLSMLRCGLRGCWWSLLSYWGWVWWSDRDEWGKVLKKGLENWTRVTHFVVQGVGYPMFPLGARGVPFFLFNWGGGMGGPTPSIMYGPFDCVC